MGVKMKLRRIFGLFAIAAKLDLLWFLRDTKYAIALMFADIISNVSTVSGVFLLAMRFNGIGGLSTDEILFMMAYSTLVTGIFVIFGSGNNVHISRIIGRGQLEHLFIQPLSLKLQLFTNGFYPFTGGTNFVVGLILIFAAVKRLQLQISFLWILTLVAYLIITMIIIVARAYLVSTMAFYAPVAAEEISFTAIDETWFLSTFPLSGMPLFVQIPLLTILPEGLMAWFPSLCLLGKPPLGLSEYYPLVFAILISIIANIFFKKGLKYYVTKGSNRYVPYGFRR